ncbi:cell agglutination protein Mam3 [Didymella sp. IMI 355093]|nr:cell agglutination protein Mam3 [Didymella sp. IMI 355093]
MAAAISASRSAMSSVNGSRAGRINMLLVCVFHAFAPLVKALPLGGMVNALAEEELPKSPEDATLWVYLGIAVALVLAGGVFAGLTIALMGQDEIYLQVLATSGEPHERRTSKKVLRLLKYGKHWVLVTLLLSNVITNETLPIVLDRSLGGGWPAVLSSTVLIVIFGEVVPQSICVRYGLPIGAWCAPMVLGLMWIMSPVAWPTAKLLDYLLGEDHGTTYKKAGLKSLVTLHKSLGHADERLNEDEVTIISAVLDLKAKPVGSIMTPMKDVFTMPSDTVLDEKMMENILSAGYSRIPIHTPENKNDFVGMLLVKMLITYDPEDALRVREFALATLPETRPETSCLDIINFFQEGKSHMVLVSDFPGDSHGAVGVVTLEDVIEELIGEEIIDESDVFIDVHKAIRRMTPAPRTRVPKGAVLLDGSRKPSEAQVIDGETDTEQDGGPRKMSMPEQGDSLRPATFMLRRRSTGNRSTDPLRADDPEVMKHLKHLGPSNAANRPKSTRINTVKIKPGQTSSPAPEIPATIPENARPASQGILAQESHAPEGGIGEGLLSSAAGEASDGVHSLAVGYGTMAAPNGDRMSWKSGKAGTKDVGEDAVSPGAQPFPSYAEVVADGANGNDEDQSRGRRNSHSTIGSLHSGKSQSPPKKRHTARSGSISENIIDVNGIKKIVLETTSSSDSDDKLAGSQADVAQDSRQQSEDESPHPSKGESKKKRKKRGKKKNKGGNSSESQPLLGNR